MAEVRLIVKFNDSKPLPLTLKFQYGFVIVVLEIHVSILASSTISGTFSCPKIRATVELYPLVAEWVSRMEYL